MRNAPFGGDGVELHAALVGLANGLETVMAPPHPLPPRVGTAMKPRPSAAITFISARSSNSATTRGWMCCARNHVSSARRNVVFSAGNNAGASCRDLGKLRLSFAASFLLRAKGRAGFAQRMVEGLEVGAAGRRFVGQHDVQPMRGELRQQVLQFALAADHMDGLRHRKTGARISLVTSLGNESTTPT